MFSLNINNRTKTLLTVGVVILLVYFLYNSQKAPIQNEGSVVIEEAPEETNVQVQDVTVPQIEEETEEDVLPNAGFAPEQDRRFNRRNKAHGKNKKISYAEGNRAQEGEGVWNKYFEAHNNLVGDSQGSNDNFVPVEEANNSFAKYNGDGKAGTEPEDLFNPDNMLPQEQNDDWFDVMPEPIKVKNRHLINVTKPIGINTTGTSKRYASHDLRGNVACPKFVVSP